MTLSSSTRAHSGRPLQGHAGIESVGGLGVLTATDG
jgi:hypothetical protein